MRTVILVLAVFAILQGGLAQTTYDATSNFTLTFENPLGAYEDLSKAQNLLEAFKIWREKSPSVAGPLSKGEQTKQKFDQQKVQYLNKLDQFVTFTYSESGKFIPFYLSYVLETIDKSKKNKYDATIPTSPLSDRLVDYASRCHRKGSFHYVAPIEHIYSTNSNGSHSSLVIVRYFGMYCRNKKEITIMASKGFSKFTPHQGEDIEEIVRYVAADIIYHIEDEFYQ